MSCNGFREFVSISGSRPEDAGAVSGTTAARYITDMDKTTKLCGAVDNIANQILDTMAIVV